MRPLQRFFQARSIAVVGGAWAENAIKQLLKSNYKGDIWPVHPQRSDTQGLKTFKQLSDLPAVPDATFLGVNRLQTIEMVKQLSAIGAGGAICFASGFKEAQQQLEADQQTDLQAELLEAAGDMPILGPNCYGFLNYLDNVTLWPDQHGGRALGDQQQGVAIIAQSSNIAINLTMQRRGLAISHVLTVGNQAMIGVSQLMEEMVLDDRVRAIGLYLEGVDDLARFVAAAKLARAANKPIVAIKIGKSEKSRLACLTHTASLTGASSASSAMLKRLGIVEVDGLDVFLETLKLLHHFGADLGPVKGDKIVSVSCSGGEASLMADLAEGSKINYADFSTTQKQQLESILGSKVGLANPLDYHTYIWGDVAMMTDCFSVVASGEFDLSVFVLDTPREDVCATQGHECAIESIIAAKKQTKAPIVVLASMPENLNETVSQRFIDAGVVPLHGMPTGLAAISACIKLGRYLNDSGDLWISRNVNKNNALNSLSHQESSPRETRVLDEVAAKQVLASFGLNVPKGQVFGSAKDVTDASSQLSYPVVIKALGFAHKTEANAVRINITSADQLTRAVDELPSAVNGYLVEQMVLDKCVELLIGITVDETGVVLLTLGAGGVLTEILSDTVSLALPVTDRQIWYALNSLQCSPLLGEYRGAEPANMDAIVDSVQAVCAYAHANIDSLVELDINPLIVGSERSVAADALIIVRGDV